ncbi:hypothetical protein RvY_13277 [Ramazzottius varieornatus]|uniref:Receptor ligand binding region domain-containing protein n=1 Tax=Ramazzottius varieornatus TaxID=947166 RepID=A0A1D1VP67_RAMVA|nr:hypothetical protein RvY_13277 [Ramazzottius varieornatus]
MNSILSIFKLVLLVVAVPRTTNSASNQLINIVILVLGEDPSYGYYATSPMYDLAFRRASTMYPELSARTRKHVLYQKNVKDCAAAGADMLDVAGKLFDLLDSHDGPTVLLAPGCSLEMMNLADFARGR